ncbi:fibroblast growth factor-binding protein 1 [Cottoperca gobio]|uniref:Fibroblast growth factor-binding protein 1 n=1 Tax=Cottoperca gobio TaxID=56716 RepID=A0A6J2Q8Q9_COTGO|nr:fibroblast growth factor-binding protein 1-like [Cottoperca gobio]
MFLLKTFAPLLLLAFLGQQVSLSSSARNKNRGADKTVTAAPGREQRSGNKSAASGRGKFSINNQMQCTWGAKDVEDTVRLSVKCEDREARIKGGVTDIRCEYNAKPQSCPGYTSNRKGFWRQVSRLLKRLQGNVCNSKHMVVKASMCKRAPRDAHFKLDIHSSQILEQSGEDNTRAPLLPRANSTAAAPVRTTACTVRANHRKTAEENCSGSWASVCNFFLSMLQSDDC